MDKDWVLLLGRFGFSLDFLLLLADRIEIHILECGLKGLAWCIVSIQ